jgi:hypothetical protein
MRFLFIWCFAFLLGGCNAQSSLLVELELEVASFVESMQSNDWKKIYQAKGTGFANDVPFGLFERKMQEESELTILLGHKINGFKRSDDLYAVKVEYKLDLTRLFETIEGAKEGIPKIDIVRQDAYLLWVRQEGQWVLKSAGLGAYFSLLDYE